MPTPGHRRVRMPSDVSRRRRSAAGPRLPAGSGRWPSWEKLLAFYASNTTATCRGGAPAHALGGAGQRGDAAADAGGPGAPAWRPGWSVADAGRAGRRPARRGGAEWGRLGYPRRALRLHECARGDRRAARRAGARPTSTELLALPGVGAYTARAVAAFAYGQRQPVVDTNVRRVVARWRRRARPTAAGDHRRDLRRRRGAAAGGPGRGRGARCALMELGALVCTARAPRCARCPSALRARGGSPASRLRRPDHPPRRVRRHRPAGARAAAGRAAGADAAGGRAALDVVWADAVQRDRALDGLVADGLVDPRDDGRLRPARPEGAAGPATHRRAGRR